MEEGLSVNSAKLLEKWAHAILSFSPFLLDYFVTGTGSNPPNTKRKTRGQCKYPGLASLSSAHTELALLFSACVQLHVCHLGKPEDFSDTLTQNSHGNNFLKLSHNLIMDLYTKRGRVLGRNAGIRNGDCIGNCNGN